MGKTSAQLERQVREHRDALTKKREHLDKRVREDVRDARQSLSDEVTQRTKLHEYAEQHPLATMAAAFGTGIALGMFPAGSDDRRAPADNGRIQGQRDESGGMLAGLLGGIAGPMSNTIQEELRTLLREVMGRDPNPERDDRAYDQVSEAFAGSEQRAGAVLTT